MKIAIVDGNNLAFKAYASFKESRQGLLFNSVGIPTTVLFSLLRTFSDLANKTSFDRIILCWDTSGSYYRRGIFKLYKKHRKYIDMKDYFEELDAARRHFDILGFNQAVAKGVEADDVIGFLAHSYRKQGHKIVIISDDKDFYQIIKKGIKIYRPCMEKFISTEEISDEYDFHPSRLAMVKAITGEDGDFIPGACEVDEKNIKLIKCSLGEKTAIKILGNHKTISQAIEAWQDNPKSTRPFKEILVKRKNQILKSLKLARIRVKEKYYLDWEIPLLKELVAKSLEERTPKLRTVIRLKNDLEFKTVNMPYILKQMGIKLQGSSMK